MFPLKNLVRKGLNDSHTPQSGQGHSTINLYNSIYIQLMNDVYHYSISITIECLFPQQLTEAV